ncbi:response regulator [Rhodoplanes sp. TEM]|uniref:Response regulator n=1 Tax=Rhodoplanes tepidamans TaxID=200616 RepID=A0ABT5JJV3_RHOTP|nr:MULTISPECIES: response regulator [Rhodoplanes]MDC7789589.1 response regulator [Rhodoplanes tepidamans]MDC7985657.1 response regulator [Rhodoplanes sp. TEM]MDQ0357267.1 CheY-like chemotaxis protein [Rhodoplanes tepidamans]
MDTKAIADLVSALASLAWPVLAFLVILKIFPLAVGLFKRERVRIKIGDMELSAEQAGEAFTSQIKDLQAKLVQIEDRLGMSGGSREAERFSEIETLPTRRRILWVDDIPTNNAISIDKLKGDGYDVIVARSTREAIEQIDSSSGFDLIISDMGRHESGRYVPNAGIIFAREIRQRALNLPIIIFSSQVSIQKYQQDAREAGVTAMTTSVVDLYLFIQRSLSAAGKAS